MQEELDLRQEHLIIGEILAKYPAITEAEQQVLDEWKQKSGNSQIFDAVLETKPADLLRIVTIMERMEIVRDKYLAAIPQVPVVRVYWWKNWKMYAVAASITILFISGILWLRNKNDNTIAKTEEKPLPVVQDAAPGKYKAKLVLADGSVVVLDTANNKALGQQGGASIVNEDGKLVYKTAKSEADVLYNTLYTAKGEMYSLILADGSKVWLNSQSSVHYPVSVPANQQINVTTTGEVFFDIVHNPKRQFKITVNGLNIDDIGTQFNVNAYTDEENIIVTLIEGSVRVSRGEKMALIKRGQEAIAGKMQNGNTIKVLDGADLEKAISWKNGMFQFNNDDLKTVMRQLARWYDVEVVYQGNVSNDLDLIGEMPRSMSLSKVLEVLKTQQVHFKIEGHKIIVLP
jgi:transmembrane sensor